MKSTNPLLIFTLCTMLIILIRSQFYNKLNTIIINKEIPKSFIFVLVIMLFLDALASLESDITVTITNFS